jgi:BolA protein
MNIESSMRAKIEAALSPEHLEIINESHLHAGHASSPDTGESHFRVLIVSPEFKGKSRLERHRIVNALLADELSGQIHALAIVARAPGE